MLKWVLKLAATANLGYYCSTFVMMGVNDNFDLKSRFEIN